MDVSSMLKRKVAEAPEPGLDGFPVPATKIRRLDAVVPPVEPGAGVPPPPNDERAIVVYQPAEAARNLLCGPLRPETPIRVSPDWIRSIKSTVLQEASNHRALFEELPSRDENPNLAMVPWAPAYAHVAQATTTAAASPAPGAEMMDADQDVEGASMEVEQDAAAGFAMQGEAFPQQQWPTQHCIAPQQLQVPAASYQPSPVSWSW